MIEVIHEKIPCGICGGGTAVMRCKGCRIPLCRACYRFDLFGHGCGSVNTLVFCPACAEDIDLNPWGGRRPAGSGSESPHGDER